MNCFILMILINLVSCQHKESIQIPNDGNKCNVVNVHFGESQSSSNEGTRIAGPPGKRGPAGETGPMGPRGPKGNPGKEGKPADSAKAETDILNILMSKSCQELEQVHGIKKSGHYIMRSMLSASPIYQYCDFKVHEGVSSCDELRQNQKLINGGSYKFKTSTASSVQFNTCKWDLFTCHDLKEFKEDYQSGFYRLGMDGDQYDVYCNFASDQVVTEVWHDSMQELKAESNCDTRGCYRFVPKYGINQRHILKIIDSSSECKQFIKMKCQGSVLFHNGDPYAWWISRTGEKMLYWGGATSKRKHYCACGETGTCVKSSHRCNCDNNSENLVTQDEGYITDKSKLPVQEIKLGDIGGANEKAWHRLGKLECIGKCEIS
uniref:collagen alpha-1(XI) chain-like isoform X1 n=1 Tax=Styela clava TaxID=7725 RepID=UPI001939976F|nr:collagen alpha-1(XI) chain-like isoform X1 [Styela clava]XP_039263781.1 collagen alpha-1(XI) chain-like isoform X1 [Styela clava]